MLIKHEKMIRKMFDRIYGKARYGKQVNDDKSVLEISYEHESEADEQIKKLNDKLYNLKCKMVKKFNRKSCDIDDYEDLCTLISLYENLMQEFCYKMFFCGFTLNPDNSNDQ